MPEQAFSECAVEMLHDCLVSMSVRAPTANGCFVVFHFCFHASHKLAPGVDLQQLRPCQRAALANRLKSFCNLCRVFGGLRLSLFVMAGDVENSQHIFVNFMPMRKLVVRQKKVLLVDRVRRRYVKFGPRNVAWGREIDLPEGLFDEPLFGSFFRDFCSVR